MNSPEPILRKGEQVRATYALHDQTYTATVQYNTLRLYRGAELVIECPSLQLYPDALV